MLLAQTGCSYKANNVYAANTYPAKYTSMNGLGVFEKMCVQAGSHCVNVTRLSNRLERMEAIVLIGDTLRPPAKEARDWMEEWLARKPGRTVVYVGRDFDAETYYRQQTIDRVPVADQPKARIDLADAQAATDLRLWSELEDDVFCRWFTIVTESVEHEVTAFQGEWADKDDLQPAVPVSGRSKPSWPVRIVLAPPSKTQATKPSTWKAAKKSSTAMQPAKVKSSPDTPQEQVVVMSQWSQYDIADDETWNDEWEKAPEAKSLLIGEDGTSLITRLTSPRFEGSHLLIVANGAPLLNASLIQPHFRKVAHKIIEDIQPAKRIGLLRYNDFGILVSRLTEDPDEAVGLAVLATWPMNIIIAHLTMLGILVCFALFPILGRPQALKRRSLADFGQHAESLGQMLQRAGDVRFAFNQIANYFQKVRGEAVPYWIAQGIQLESADVPSVGQAPSPTQSPTEP